MPVARASPGSSTSGARKLERHRQGRPISHLGHFHFLFGRATASRMFDCTGSTGQRSETWTYDGPAGPQHWGELNPSWQLCNSGKFQSPINVEPRMLLYDPRLRRLDAQVPDRVSGRLSNTGNDLVFRVDSAAWNQVNFTGGPFMYGYRLAEIKLKIGKTNSHGSEHLVDGRAFSAELQLVCYNSDLATSLSKAQRLPYGVAIISIFAEVNYKDGNDAFRILVDAASEIQWKGQSTPIPNLKVRAMLPDTSYYVTYDGSFTQPGCLETVTWVLFNKPIKIQASQLNKLRQLQKQQQARSGTMAEGNIRTPMPLHNRPIRTNINNPSVESLCTMKKDTFYQTNANMMIR
ncbi:carbonic anhydrase-related protein 10-like protein [Plakobranchus ocellatus]|uniref:Carbonic anhydrase-related protein 10-like protein n=1 Tax=Plakobranchus ocellatus TaxID=259542 RepID=A0AAV3YP66_9GAST|nr:carbonic anhydrase-related protein 10-like protein [Plakobranchus ocellatus]